MAENNKNIIQARRIYDEYGLGQLILELKKNTDLKTAYNSFNTIFNKKAAKASSFEVFGSIRKTDRACLYIHIPFCKNSCLYCVYEKMAGCSKQVRLNYLALLKKEIEAKKVFLGNSFNPDIFYVGGGTPMVLEKEEIKLLLDTLSGFFDLKNNLEFTFETTPAAISRPDADDKLLLLKKAGINRINVGVESFSEKVLRKNGRLQKKDDIFKGFAKLRRFGFEKINLDLIYGMGSQALQIWQEDINQAAGLSPDSITTFALRIWRHSGLYKRYINNPAAFCSETERIIMRIMAIKHFVKNNYSEDNSDYFIKSQEKKYLYHPSQPHNIFRNLIGFGPSAYSIAGNMQLFNVQKTSEYIRKIQEKSDPITSIIALDKREYMKKRLADGLRTEFDDNSFIREFSCSVFQGLPKIIGRLKNMGLIKAGKHSIRLSERGRLITDYVTNYIKYSLF
ncbi:MAG: radical SAM protein [Candidatus Omnitrophota bacterium]